jgi:hypothetical protein
MKVFASNLLNLCNLRNRRIFTSSGSGLKASADMTADEPVVLRSSTAAPGRWPQGYFVLSHFVCWIFSFGWETNKCQMTAWKASE